MAKDMSKRKAVAKHLYMKRTSIMQIVDLTGVSRQSVSRWVNQERWKEERAAREMSKESITSMTLSKLGEAIENTDANEKSISRMTDSLIKAAKGIKEINRNTNIVNKVDTILEFENWLVTHREESPEVEDKMIMLINQFQSDFMNIKFKQT